MYIVFNNNFSQFLSVKLSGTFCYFVIGSFCDLLFDKLSI